MVISDKNCLVYGIGFIFWIVIYNLMLYDIMIVISFILCDSSLVVLCIVMFVYCFNRGLKEV